VDYLYASQMPCKVFDWHTAYLFAKKTDIRPIQYHKSWGKINTVV